MERAHLERFLVSLDQGLASQDYIVGDSFTAADIVCACDLGILSSTYDLDSCPSIDAYLSRLLARPAATRFAEAVGWPATR